MWHQLKYPVRFEAREPDGNWQLAFQANNSDDLEYRMSSYVFDRRFPEFRLKAADGLCLNQTAKAVEDFNKRQSEIIRHTLQPLQNFVSCSPTNAIDTARDLIQGALRSRHFTILPKSYVGINHPCLHHIRVVEFDDSVVCRVHAVEQEHGDIEPTVTVWKTLQRSIESDKRMVNFSFQPMGSLTADVECFLTLLCSAIVRDFWVLEEKSRNAKYELRVKKERKREGKGKNRKLKKTKDYTYLPRFKYDLSVYTDKRKKDVKHTTRVLLSPAWVSGHIRRLPDGQKASEKAKANASHFGLRLMDGETFVRPHERGEVEQLRTYRSRSAFEMLFN